MASKLPPPFPTPQKTKTPPNELGGAFYFWKELLVCLIILQRQPLA